MRFRRILVPVDFTVSSRRAVKASARLTRGSEAEVTLLHVIERIEGDTGREFAAFYRRLEKAARQKMQELAREFRQRQASVRAEVLYGNRVTEILRRSEEGFDLIVMSSHKIPLKHPGEHWGTISHKVGLLSRVPVLLVK